MICANIYRMQNVAASLFHGSGLQYTVCSYNMSESSHC